MHRFNCHSHLHFNSHIPGELINHFLTGYSSFSSCSGREAVALPITNQQCRDTKETKSIDVIEKKSPSGIVISASINKLLEERAHLWLFTSALSNARILPSERRQKAQPTPKIKKYKERNNGTRTAILKIVDICDMS